MSNVDDRNFSGDRDNYHLVLYGRSEVDKRGDVTAFQLASGSSS